MTSGTQHRAALAAGYESVTVRRRLFRSEWPIVDLASARRLTADWIHRCSRPVAPDVSVDDVWKDGGLRWRILTPVGARSREEVFVVHGGGLVFYSVEEFTPLWSRVAVRSRCPITLFHYPTAPETHPDVIVATLVREVRCRLSELPDDIPLRLAGDSIGGFISLYLALCAVRDRVSRLVLIYPVLDLLRQRPSYVTYGSGYCLDAPMMAWFQTLWQGGRIAAEFSPFSMHRSDWEALPPVDLISAEFDVLRDDSFEWAALGEAAGIAVRHHHHPTLAHDFCLYDRLVPDARGAIDGIADCIGDRRGVSASGETEESHT